MLMFFAQLLSAQSNSPEQVFFLQPGDQFSTIIYSSQEPTFLFNNGFDSRIWTTGTGTSSQSLGKNQYKVEFEVSDTYAGLTELDVEYFETIGVRTLARYTRLVFDVAESQLIPKHDYKTITVNSQNEAIDVLSNDFTTHGPLEISQIAHEDEGTVSIANNQLLFTPDANYMGMAYVNYVVRNALGREAMGTATICVLDPNLVAADDVINLATKYDKSVPVLLPSDNFNVDNTLTLQHGTIETLGPDVFEYTPNGNVSVTESFVITDPVNGLTRSVNIQIIGDDAVNNAVVNDKVFTAINHAVSFDVFDNDFVKGNPIVSYSPELTHLGGGDFSYNPPQNYQGIKYLYYEVFDGYEYAIGEIAINVDNFYPEEKPVYEFVTKKATAFVINYSAPLETFGFQIVSQPENGKLRLLNGNSSYYYACGYDIGYNLLVYEPGLAFTGVDNFSISYCINDEQCKSIDIAINVVNASVDCNCVGSDCVWAGDANADGKVSISDLLAIGYHMGATGPDRTSGDTWSAEFGDDWGANQIGSSADLKNLDANGDGIVTAADTVALSQFYDNYNNLVAVENLVTKDYPVQLIPSATAVDSGDWLSLEIVIGSEEFPVVDVHGIAYSLNLNPGIVDSASVQVIDNSRVWLGNNSPILHMFKQPSDGRLDIASSRTTGQTVSGKGLTHTVGFIVEEDLEGLRRGRRNPVEILIENISFVDGAGNSFKLPDASVVVELNTERTSNVVQEDALHIMPNPASDFIRLYLNGLEEIQAVDIYNLEGKLVYHADDINTHDYKIPTIGMADGMYVARVVTANQSFTKKVKVVKTR